MLDRVRANIKTAMLAGQKTKVTILRGLLAAVQSAQIDSKTDLTDEQIVAIFSKESKKRTEAADMYISGGSQDRADEELAEKKIIDEYLPTKISTDELEKVIDSVVDETKASGMADMGKVVSSVKTRLGASADGSEIAKIVKNRLSAR
ncbi:GatB/YqeY domain-containing protein [Candidatus Saccharibacteria bacterium]|jgi:uncharacterized protein YqeY|nr:GatB/YqeY domain-containing protein [Candidatus Saccharibacteria bacterium]MBP9131868.1 GatB/YqeY domain-containing protein [Candidatus Saccharibacteria bacterium]